MQLEFIAFSGGTLKGTAEFDDSERVVMAHGRFADPTARNNVYMVSDTGGQTAPAGLSTAPATVSLYNPIGSGVFCSLQ